MHFSTLIVGAIAAFSSAAQAATLYVDNNCTVPLYLRSSSDQTGQGPVITLKPKTINAYHETMRGPGFTKNTLTVARNPALNQPIQAGYTQSNNGITYYTLSTLFGDPFKLQGFSLVSGADGYNIRCPPRPGNTQCPGTYNPTNPNGNGAVFTQPNTANMALRLCQFQG